MKSETDVLQLAPAPERRSSSTRICAIPSHATPLIGRQFALEQVVTQLNRSPTVLWGPPGIGKSRLAHAAAQRWFDARGDGDVWVIDLAAARDESEALATIASGLGLPGGGRAAKVRAQIERMLGRDRPILLVLDHCEHLGQPVEAWLSEWNLRPGAEVMATSRVRLDGFDPYEVPALTSDEALRLLESCARRVRTSFNLTDTSRDELRELIVEVDALPAALELMGARLLLLTPAKLLKRVRSGGATLADALSQSWQLLEAEEREALQCLAATRGGFDVDLAEALLGVEGLETLESLVQHAWLHVEDTADGPRMVLLHEAHRFLAERVSEAARAAHASAMIEFGEAWEAGIETGDEVRSTRLLAANLPNLWAAWDWVRDDTAVARLGLLLHMTLQRAGDHERQQDVTERALAAAHRSGDRHLIGRAELARARCLRWSGRFSDAIEALKQSLEYGDAATRCSALRNLAASAWAGGDLEKTREWSELALKTALEEGTSADEVTARNGLGFLLTTTGDFVEARANLERAFEIAHGSDHGLVALVSSSLASLEAREENWLEAERHSTRAIDIYEALNYRRQRALEHLYRAEARIAAGRVRAAEADALAAAEMAADWAFDQIGARALYVKGVVLLVGGDAKQAYETLAAAEFVAAQREDFNLARETARALAATRVVLGQPSTEKLAGDDPWASYLDAVSEGETATVPEIVTPMQGAIVRALQGRTRRLEVADEGRFFRYDNDCVNLTRRKALRGILHVLAERHRDDPVTMDELLEAGWPGEVMTPESGTQRVYMTVKRLRNLGLEQVILTVGDGYMLDPDIELVRAAQLS